MNIWPQSYIENIKTNQKNKRQLLLLPDACSTASGETRRDILIHLACSKALTNDQEINVVIEGGHHRQHGEGPKVGPFGHRLLHPIRDLLESGG
jgi:hypothetical protein